MFDLRDEPIEIIVSQSGNVVWINSKDKCLVRVTMPTRITVDIPNSKVVNTDVHGEGTGTPR